MDNPSVETYWGDRFIRVEAVNLDSCVYDTHDISTIRGGSFIINEVMERLGKLDFLKKVSAGASIGLYRLVEDIQDPERIIREKLDEWCEGHATFVIGIQERKPEDDFKALQERLLAQCRWTQWKQLTIPWGKGGWKGADKPCDIDGIRPGLVREYVPEKELPEWHSEPVDFRRREGRKLRQAIYKRIGIEIDPEIDFANNLLSLSEDPKRGDLSGKIAFIYADGNKFTKIRNQFCYRADLGFEEQIKALQEFEEIVQRRFRAPFLKNVIDEIKEDTNAARPEVRLETLMWGGDEFEIIVPAWWGWRVLQLLFDKDLQQSLPSEPHDLPLTHAAGIVFCNHHTPILRVRRLAKNLVDRIVKEGIEDIPADHASGNLVQYINLTSMDLLELEDIQRYAEYYAPADVHHLTVTDGEINSITSNMLILKQWFPRSRIYEIIHALKNGCDYQSVVERGLTLCHPERKGTLAVAIQEIIDDKPDRWFLIADLWDYIL